MEEQKPFLEIGTEEKDDDLACYGLTEAKLGELLVLKVVAREKNKISLGLVKYKDAI